MSQPPRILLIDDNKSVRALVLRELQREFSQLHVQEIISSGEFKQAMDAGEFDAVITDFQLRWTTGLDILQEVKRRYPRCPVIMFTNTGTEEIAVEAMKLGLDDYIIKDPNRYVRVPASVRVALERAKAQQQAALLEIRFRSLLDRLDVGVFRVNVAGVLLDCNPAFLSLLGVNSLEQASQSFDFQESYAQLIESPKNQTQEQEIELCKSDGTIIWALISTILTDINGEIVIDGLLKDITERKQAELERQQLNQVLEQQLRERKG